ncbi:hypothetical protein QTP86_008549 [Hemibagrus guttatus]|nr:hypothetical protein QTP86_008549 [Hemibagrus guttatus]
MIDWISGTDNGMNPNCNTMQKDGLMQFIQCQAHECLQHAEKADNKEAYLFWQMMELFCDHNGKFSSWGDIMDSEFPEPTPLFDQQLLEEGEEPEGDEEEDEEMLAHLLRDEPDDDELRLNLSSIGDREKLDFLDALVDSKVGPSPSCSKH